MIRLSTCFIFLLFKLFCVPVVAQKQITIGQQTWASQNLGVDHFANGDLILQAKTDKEWKTAGENKQPAWCYYNNDSTNDAIFGKLYNWYAVADSRKLCPVGWEVPTNSDWDQMTRFLGGMNKSSLPLKSTTLWEDYRGRNGNGTNKTNFNGVPGGYREINGPFPGEFLAMGKLGKWWTSIPYNRYNAGCRALHYHNDTLGALVENCDMSSGYSVRCIRK